MISLNLSNKISSKISIILQKIWSLSRNEITSFKRIFMIIFEKQSWRSFILGVTRPIAIAYTAFLQNTSASEFTEAFVLWKEKWGTGNSDVILGQTLQMSKYIGRDRNIMELWPGLNFIRMEFFSVDEFWALRSLSMCSPLLSSIFVCDR